MSRLSCKQSDTLTGLTLNGKCAQSFAEEKYAIDASTVRAAGNGHHDPNKWFSIVRGIIMFKVRLVTRLRCPVTTNTSVDPLSILVSLNYTSE